MKTKIFLTMLLASSISLSAIADDKTYYAQINAGGAAGSKVSFTGLSGGTQKVKTGYTGYIGVEAGGRINDYIKLGLAFDYYNKFSFDIRDETTPEINGTSYTISKKPKISSTNMLLNLSIFCGEFNGVKPYIFGAVGGAYNSADSIMGTDSAGNSKTLLSGDSNVALAYKFGIGTKYIINDDFDVDFHYSYANLGKLAYKKNTYSSSQDLKLKANVVSLGIAFKF